MPLSRSLPCTVLLCCLLPALGGAGARAAESGNPGSQSPVVPATGVQAGLAVKVGPGTLEELRALTNGGRMLVACLVADRAGQMICK